MGLAIRRCALQGWYREMLECRACGAHERANYEAREMMFGLRVRFHYAQCVKCGSLWLTDPPDDFAKYYPGNYYAFSSDRGAKEWFKNLLRTERDKSYFGAGSLAGRFLASRYEDGGLRSVSRLVGRGARVLDVGCGNGRLLHRMARLGFQFLQGVDPFIEKESRAGNGVRIRKCQLEDIRGEEYDLIMLHHSLEHVPNPRSVLQAVAELLGRGGKCLIRLPVVASAWEKYGTNWVQLDPPRHMWLPTEKAMRILVESVGLEAENVEYDSGAFQFWGSELYVRDIPLKGVHPGNLGRFFRRDELKEFRVRAARLNGEGRGDQAAFVLRKPS